MNLKFCEFEKVYLRIDYGCAKFFKKTKFKVPFSKNFQISNF